MVAETQAVTALAPPADDPSWLFDAPRGSHSPIHGRPGWHYCRGTETIYEVSDGAVDPVGCECEGWKFRQPKECAHIAAVRRPSPEKRVGACPVCGEDVVCEITYVEGAGYLLTVRCWSNECDYRRVI